MNVNDHSKEKDEPQLLPEFIEKMKLIEQQKSIRLKSIASRYHLD